MKKMIFMAICAIALLACTSTSNCTKNLGSPSPMPFSVENSIAIEGTDNFIVQKNCNYGIETKDGEVVLPYIFKEIVQQNNVLLVENLEGQSGVLTLNGEVIIEPKYTYISLHDNIIEVMQDYLSGAFDMQGHKLTDIAYRGFREHEKVFVAYNDNGDEVFDYTGRKILPFPSNEIAVYTDVITQPITGEETYRETLVFFADSQRKWGMISLENNFSIAPEFDDLMPFCDDFLGQKDNKMQVIRRDGLRSKFYDEISIVNRWYIVRNKNQHGVLSADFNELLPLKYNAICETDFDYKYLFVYQNGKLGVYDGKKFILPIKYDDIYCYQDKEQTFWSVVKNGKHGLFTEEGRVLFFPKYSSISFCTRSDNWQIRDWVVSIGDKFTRHSIDGKFIKNITGRVFFNIEDELDKPYVPWEDVKSQKLLSRDAYVYNIVISGKE